MVSTARALTIDRDPVHLAVPHSAFALPGFRAWVTSEAFPEKVHASWIDGEVLIDMSPEAIDAHNDVKTEIIAALRTIARDEQLGRLHGDGVLFTNEPAGVSTEPDVVFISFEAIEKGLVQFVPKARGGDDDIELQGSPDLVVEIVSDASVRKDTVLLRAAYARARVREYWIIDSRGDTPRFEMLVLRSGKYHAARRSAVFGRAFRLERAKDRVGRWSHRLRSLTR